MTAEAALSGVMALVDLRMGRAADSPAATRHRKEAIGRVYKCVSGDVMVRMCERGHGRKVLAVLDC